MSRLRRWARRLQRRWHVYLLRQRGWPDPAGTLDWLEARNSVLLITCDWCDGVYRFERMTRTRFGLLCPTCVLGADGEDGE